MNWLHTSAVLLAAFLAVFCESYFRLVRNLVGAQIDLLPALLVYAGLRASVATVALLATFGGLWFDSLSANPLGITVLPLLITGLVIHAARDIVPRDRRYGQFLVGLGASALVPVFSVLSLIGAGAEPLLGWWSLWQWVVLAAGGAAFTPAFFFLFNRFDRAFQFEPLPETSFRPDREIKRDRVPHPH